MSKTSRGDRFYHALLGLLPFDFRSDFAGEMVSTFRQERAARGRGGWLALVEIWWTAILDVLRMAPREHLSILSQDIRYALRMMRRNPGYTTAAVAVLGLGIGANTSIFSVVHAVLLKPLPYAEGDGLVVLRQRATKAGAADLSFSVKEIDDYRQQNRSLSGLVEYHSMTFTLLGRNEAHRVRTGVVSAGFFDFFGVKPLLGRTFVPEDDRLGAPPVLVLSYEYWKQSEAGDPNIIGRKFEMNDRSHTVIGVLPPIPQYPNENDVYMPTSACPFRSSPAMISSRTARMMSVFGRLKPRQTLNHCRSDMALVAARLAQDHPEAYPTAAGFDATASSLRDDLTRKARPMLLVLFGAAAIVLLIACANVANLTMSRMARREQELVVRTAMGAGAGRLLRQLLTESLLLALLAAAVGLLLAAGSLRLLAQFVVQLTPRAREIGIDGWVLAFAVLCAVITTVFFGSVAALASRRDLAACLKESGSRSGAEVGRPFFRGALIAAQVAFSYVLLIGAGLMVRSFIQLDRVEPGFVPQRVFAAGLDANWSRYTTPQLRLSLAKRILDRVQSQPGILSAAISSSFPLDPDSASGGWTNGFDLEGEVRTATESPHTAAIRVASPDYFRTLGIPLLGGRVFRDADDEKAPDVAVISRSLARRFWPGRDPIGRRVTFDRGEHWVTIVGIAGDVKEFTLAGDAPDQFYVPLAQNPAVGSILVRTSGEPSSVAAEVRRAVLEVDPQTAIPLLATLEQVRADSVSGPRATARLFALFAGLAFVIAVVGIGCMLGLWVKQRTREIGIRMAMGAAPRDITGLVIRQGMLLAAVGTAAGVAGALAAGRSLKTLLYHVEPADGGTYALVSALLLGAALLACYLPARRAARVDPQVALRSE